VKLLVAAVLVAAGSATAQDPDLGPVAELARKAFLEHRFDRLFEDGTSVRLRLPDQPGGPPVGRSVAVAALEVFARGFAEIDVAVLGAAVLEDRLGYVELRRRFRLNGVGEEQDQRILLSVRFGDSAWRVVEVWISP
jgi:hypothetical protein